MHCTSCIGEKEALKGLPLVALQRRFELWLGNREDFRVLPSDTLLRPGRHPEILPMG